MKFSKIGLREITDYGLPKPIISQMVGGINVDILSNVTENVTENVTVKRIDKILEELKTNNTATTEYFAKKYRVTRWTILRDLEKLKLNNKIIRIGPDKGGYWKIL